MSFTSNFDTSDMSAIRFSSSIVLTDFSISIRNRNVGDPVSNQ